MHVTYFLTNTLTSAYMGKQNIRDNDMQEDHRSKRPSPVGMVNQPCVGNMTAPCQGWPPQCPALQGLRRVREAPGPGMTPQSVFIKKCGCHLKVIMGCKGERREERGERREERGEKREERREREREGERERGKKAERLTDTRFPARHSFGRKSLGGTFILFSQFLRQKQKPGMHNTSTFWE